MGRRDGSTRLRELGKRWRQQGISPNKDRHLFVADMAAPRATCSISKAGAHLRGLYNKPVQLDDGRTVLADDSYHRESILDPNAKVVSGFEPNIMPNFKGQVSEENVIQLIAYIKSLSPPTPAPAGRSAAARGDRPQGRSAAPRRRQQRQQQTVRKIASYGNTPRTQHRKSKPSQVNYLNVEHGWKSWLLTTDHKRIAILYLISITLMFFVGGTMAVVFRINLLEPRGHFRARNLQPPVFDARHRDGVLLPGAIDSGNARQFPDPDHGRSEGSRVSAHQPAELVPLYRRGHAPMYAVLRGGVDTGWTFYTPYSSTYSNSYVLAAALGVFIAGFSSILTGLNFIVTVHKMRAPGMTWSRLPLFVWSNYATGLIQVLGTPVLAIVLLLLAFERIAHVGIFDPNIGGDPILFQHLFWFYSHPAVYIMILPGMGVISEIVSCFSRKRVFGYNFVAFSSMAIAVLSFVVWGHHMFVTGESMYTALPFSILSFSLRSRLRSRCSIGRRPCTKAPYPSIHQCCTRLVLLACLQSAD